MSLTTPGQHCTHKIRLNNIKDGDVFVYSLIICKGHIENSDCLSCLTIKTESEIHRVEINTKTNCFKCILELKSCSTVFTFEYCTISMIISLNYRHETNLTVLPLYIVCNGHDGKFQAPASETNTPESACKRITTGCKLIQSVVGDVLHDVGMERKAFNLESDCVVFYSKLNIKNALEMSQMDLWYYFAREIMSSSIGSLNKKYLAFLSCTLYDGRGYYEEISYNDMLRLVKGYVAYGGNGLALLSTACLYTWPQTVQEIYDRFHNKEMIDKSKFMDDSSSRGTWSGCFATTLGAALHELCHTFDLGHTDTGIMGRDFGNVQNMFMSNLEEKAFSGYRSGDVWKTNADYTNWSKSSLVILNYHKWFNNTNSELKCSIHYDDNNKIIRSTAGIRVVEIRRDSDGMVLKSWIFMGKVLKFSFQVPEELNNNKKSTVLFVEDNCGNIFKQSI